MQHLALVTGAAGAILGGCAAKLLSPATSDLSDAVVRVKGYLGFTQAGPTRSKIMAVAANGARVAHIDGSSVALPASEDSTRLLRISGALRGTWASGNPTPSAEFWIITYTGDHDWNVTISPELHAATDSTIATLSTDFKEFVLFVRLIAASAGRAAGSQSRSALD